MMFMFRSKKLLNLIGRQEYVDELAELLKCTICLEELNEPKVLDCQHIFCKKCLKGYLESLDKYDTACCLICPLCRCHTQYGGYGVDEGLKSSILAENMIEILQRQRKSLAVEPKLLKIQLVPILVYENKASNKNKASKSRRVAKRNKLPPARPTSWKRNGRGRLQR